MTSSKLLRWGGLAALVGGVLFIVAVFLILTVDLSSYGEAVTTATFTLHATVLLHLGLVGLYVSQLERVGILGFVGFLVAFIGTAFALGLNWAEVFFAHTLAEVAPNCSTRVRREGSR